MAPDQAPRRTPPVGDGITVAQAAGRIGCAQPYVRKLLSNGTLSAVEETDVPGRPELLRLTSASVNAAVAAERVRERQRQAYQVPYDPAWHAVATAAEHPRHYPNYTSSSPDSGRSLSEQFDSGVRWVGVPALLLGFVLIAVLHMPGAWAAKHGHGQRGTLTITRHECQRVKFNKVCSWRGDFSTNPDAPAGPNSGTAADGTPVRNIGDVAWDDNKHHVGERIPALAEPDDEVYGLRDSHAFDRDVMFAAGGAIGLLVWGVLVVRKLRRRRAQPS